MVFCNFLQSLHCNVGTNLKINVLHLWVGVRIFFHWTKAFCRISSVEKCFCENFLSFRCGHYGGLVLHPPPCYSFPSFGRVVNTHGWIFSVLHFYNHCTVVRFSHGHWMAKDSCRHFSHQASFTFWCEIWTMLISLLGGVFLWCFLLQLTCLVFAFVITISILEG